MSQFKQIVVQIHVDNIVRSLRTAPQQAVRRLVELGLSICDNPVVKRQKEQLCATLSKLVDEGRINEVKQWFADTFIGKNE